MLFGNPHLLSLINYESELTDITRYSKNHIMQEWSMKIGTTCEKRKKYQMISQLVKYLRK